MVVTANLGFPRMGVDRELKWALERPGGATSPLARAVGDGRRAARAGTGGCRPIGASSRIPSGDFSLYDHVLDTALTLGAVPGRFGGRRSTPTPSDADALARYFAMAAAAPTAARRSR